MSGPNPRRSGAGPYRASLSAYSHNAHDNRARLQRRGNRSSSARVGYARIIGWNLSDIFSLCSSQGNAGVFNAYHESNAIQNRLIPAGPASGLGL